MRPPILLRDLAAVPGVIPVHFQIPMMPGRSLVLSISGDGHYMWSFKDGPTERLPDTPGCTPHCVTSFGAGPVIFVEVDLDGSYFTRPALPSVAPSGMRFATIKRIIKTACAVLGRPSRFAKPNPLEALLRPVGPDSIAKCLSSPCILTFDKWDWGIMFYIRVDLRGYYHVYPHVGGPFETLDEVYSAIECDLKQRQDPKIMTPQPEDTQVDYVVRQCLYWPDGKRKKRFNVDERRDRRRLLVQALVDKYNDYIGDLVYELKDVVHYESVCVKDAYVVTYHINFTTKILGSEEEELFFAEVTCDIKTGERNFVVSCFWKIKPFDNGTCYGCNAKHPNAAVYLPGQAGACFPFGASNVVREDCDEDPVAEEKRLRTFYEKLVIT